jgi:hypothetical protein
MGFEAELDTMLQLEVSIHQGELHMPWTGTGAPWSLACSAALTRHSARVVDVFPKKGINSCIHRVLGIRRRLVIAMQAGTCAVRGWSVRVGRRTGR